MNNPDDGFGEIWALDEADFSKEGVIIKAYFPDTLFLPELVPNIKLRIEELKTFGLNIAPNNIKVDEVAEENWATAWKKILPSFASNSIFNSRSKLGRV